MPLLHSDAALGAFFWRLFGRMDMPRAAPTDHRWARMLRFMVDKNFILERCMQVCGFATALQCVAVLAVASIEVAKWV